VLPISSSLLTKIHDYGALSKEVEQDYIKAILGSLFNQGGFSGFNNYLNKLVTGASICQNYVKKLNNNESSLSLRDLHRVKTVFEFYVKLLNYKKHFKQNFMTFEEFSKTFVMTSDTLKDSVFQRAFIISLILNYLNRLTLPSKKKELESILFNSLKIEKLRHEWSFEIILFEECKPILERMQKLGKLPKDIAVNGPFKENIFAIFVSIYSKTPLFICGKPGSSKSVSVQIIKRTFDGQSLQNNPSFLDGMKPLRFEYYQGSDQSTDKGVENVFTKALFHQRRGVKQSVVFIDEIGLAELSPNNPLKVLHKFLDTTSHVSNTSTNC
jgi:hypothetical protein